MGKKSKPRSAVGTSRSAAGHPTAQRFKHSLRRHPSPRLLEVPTARSVSLYPKITTRALQQLADDGQPIVALTAYDFPMAKILDQCGVDIILVGDSVGNVLLGDENTLPVTVDDMVRHTRAVSRAVKRAMVVADMPFMSFQLTPIEALRNAARLVREGGATAVKLEGAEYTQSAKEIIRAGIPVMGHVGLTPQSVNAFGGYGKRGKLPKEAKRILADAQKLEDAGCFAVVLEMVPELLARQITKALKIPTIGIGAGPDCDGQILVINDLLGITEKPPSFVKPLENLRKRISAAVRTFSRNVRLEGVSKKRI